MYPYILFVYSIEVVRQLARGSVAVLSPMASIFGGECQEEIYSDLFVYV